MTSSGARLAVTAATATALLISSGGTAFAATSSADLATGGSTTPGRRTPAHQAGTLTAQAVPGQYIVTYRVGRTPGAATPAKLGVRSLHTYTKAVRGFAAKLTPAQLAQVRSDPAVASVEPDTILKADGTQAPTPSWGLDRVDQASLPLDSSYTYPYDGSGVTAYVIDTGLRTTHAEFSSRVGTGVNFVPDSTGAVDPANVDDCSGHGTHVAGTIGGTTHGVAKGVTIVPVRVLDCTGSATVSSVIAGVDWVTAHHSGPSVANMSLGGPVSTALDTAVQNSISSGVTYVLSAGNSAADACNYSPGRVAAAITVGATGSIDAGGNLVSGTWDQAAQYSNYGSCLDLYAPGTAITSAGTASDTATLTESGTSMAAPHVTGLAAQFLQAHPGSTPGQLRTYLVGYGIHGVLGQMLPGDPNVLAHVPADNEGPLVNGIGRAVSRSTITATIAASDATSVAGFSYVWNHTATATTAVVDTVADTTGPTITTRVPDGVWYLHVRAVDSVGNWSGVYNSGAFVVDVTVPRVTVIRAKPAAPNRYRTYIWASDNVTGVKFYRIVWNHSRTSAAGPAVVTTSSIVVSPRLVRGTWFVHVQAVDRNGNASPWGWSGAYTTPQKFVSGRVTQGARCSASVRGYFGYTRTGVLERCMTTATSKALRWRPF
jgi:subtilisin family serine protease